MAIKYILPNYIWEFAPIEKNAKKHFRKINYFLPKIGAITVLKLTKNQFENTVPLVDEINKSEKIVGKMHILWYNPYKSLNLNKKHRKTIGFNCGKIWNILKLRNFLQ